MKIKTVIRELKTPLETPQISKGFNNTICCLGVSGGGKTHTIHEIFRAHLDMIGYPVLMSYIEIYQEKIYDLLFRGNELGLRGIPKEKSVGDKEEALMVLRGGDLHRTTKTTLLNARSSRSHAILSLKLKSGELLTFVDLAGSESLDRANSDLVECRGINKSLLALGTVINRLSSKAGFVNYRDSLLTMALKPSLQGSVCTFLGCIRSREDPREASTLAYLRKLGRISIDVKQVKGDQEEDEVDYEALSELRYRFLYESNQRFIKEVLKQGLN